MTISSVMTPLKRRQNLFSLPPHDLEIRRPAAKIRESRPHQLAAIGEDIRCRLQRTMTYTATGPSRFLREAREGREEEIAGRELGGGTAGVADRDVQCWRGEVGAGFVSPVCANEWGEQGER